MLVGMQSTANLWDELCRDLEARRALENAEQCGAAARSFEDAAKQVFAADSPRLQDALEITGDIHQTSGTTDDAMRCFGEALKMARAAGMHAAVARIATKLAMMSEGVVDPKTTVRFYVQAIEAMERANENSQKPTMLNNLASLHQRTGDAEACERTYRRALREAEKLHGPDHQEVALISNNLGVALMEAGRLDQAEDFHLRALAIRERNFGGRHPEVAQSMSNLAAVYAARKRYPQAENFYRAAMDTLSSFRGPDDPEMVAMRRDYESLPPVRLRGLSKTRKLA